MARFIQVGSWVFDPRDVKAVKLGFPPIVGATKPALTVHIAGCEPISLNEEESAAFLAYLADSGAEAVLSEGPYPVGWKSRDTSMRAGSLPLDI